MVYWNRQSHEREIESKRERERERDRRRVFEKKMFPGSVTNRLFE